MKTKLTAIVIALAACRLAAYGQETSDPNHSNPAPAVAPVTEPTTPSPAATPVVAGADKASPAAATGNNEQVPLIVIDDVPLTDAIRNLARQSGLNFQFDPRITATNQPNISIRFENVTPQAALDAVLENHSLKLIKDTRSGIGRITYKDPKAEEPLVSRIIQLKYSDPTNLTSIVKSTLSPRSQVMADARTSQLIVTTTEKEMEAVTNLINTLDLPTRQVLIEAKLLETAHSPSTIKGINWSGTFESQNFQLGNNALSRTPPTIGAPGLPADPGSIGGILGNPRVLVDSASGFNPATAFLNADGVNAVFSFFNKDADSEVIATPRAVTLDNQTAILSVTRAFPIFQVTPGSANSPAGAQITYTNLGTILYVTPRIAADDNISLRVVPEVSNIDSKDEQTINGEINIANVYAIRRMEANVMIPSGHTLVMGGLVSDNTTKNYTKVPVLGDLPGLGWFFRSKGKSRDKSNLIIFVTPTIVESNDFYANAAGREFLNTRSAEKAEEIESDWDSAKPHDWTKPQ
jgi:type II secretory pathway component GspD/PulD (secretin)